MRGYKEEGTTTTPFDMCVINDLDRFHLVIDVIDRVPGLAARAAYAKQAIRDKLIDHREYIRRYGDDMPEIKDWTWGGGTAAGRGGDVDGGGQRLRTDAALPNVGVAKASRGEAIKVAATTGDETGVISRPQHTSKDPGCVGAHGR